MPAEENRHATWNAACNSLASRIGGVSLGTRTNPAAVSRFSLSGSIAAPDAYACFSNFTA